jgi:hypothetical protein
MLGGKTIVEEAETTRRHFTIMVERMSELMKPIADASCSTTDSIT